ncbi:hypothetical protein [Natronobiforma cellulositropha]|uniref:hypothetical protein n=1 Tax=Natronobiforma cellulositropha TaxID=1679076 RepID=UPI0021D59D24|nr:hypothetical protein [Natronobiforma cellulositropha]
MAREPPGSTLESADSDVTGTKRERNTGLLGRRAYLARAGTLATGALATSTSTAAASERSSEAYETIRLSRGERRTFEVGNGETFENVLIDCTAGNCWPVVVAHGTNWTIRNVGIEGRLGNTNAIFGVSDRRGNSSVMENIYLGDGAASAHRAGLGIWVAPQHRGHIDMRNVNVQEMGDNSFYCSAPGGNGGGTVHIDGCYSANSWVSHFRLAEGRVTDSVAVNDSRHKDGRGVWAWSPGTVEVDGCDLAMNGRHYALHSRGSRLVVSNTQYDTGFNGGTRRVQGGTIDLRGGNGTNPRDVVPEGCPTSAVEAASGARSDAEPGDDGDGDEQGAWSTLVVDGREATGTTDYEFTVDGGAIEPTTESGATVDPQTSVDGGRASGVVANWLDAYRFEGRLESLTLEGEASVRVNGVVVDPEQLF